MTMDQDIDDIKRQLQEITDRFDQFHDKCYYRSAMRLAREKRRLAKAERRLIPYLYACFAITNSARDTLEVEAGVEAAIEMISLLESEEKARQFQSDFPEENYDKALYWISACAYDNLATHVASREGFNSDGVHDAIEDGIQICRRTGKTQCIACFREYASKVFIAAGDLEMAMHHARTVATSLPLVEDSDRRWSGSLNIIEILLLQGHLDAAVDAARNAFGLTSTFHSPLQARIETRRWLEEILLLQGRQADFNGICAKMGCAVEADELPHKDEYPLFDYYQSLREALELCCRGQHEEAVRLLNGWDRRLTDCRHLANWFETRLRLVAASYLSGNMDRTHALARQLESKAKESRNWITLERLRGLLDGRVHASPLALLSPLSSGPFAAPTIVKAATTSGADDTANNGSAGNAGSVGTEGTAADASSSNRQSGAAEVDETPLGELIKSLLERITAAGEDEAAANAILDDILRLPPEQVANEKDAIWLIYLAGFPLRIVGRAGETWPWAEAVANRFPHEATVQNLLADLGFNCRCILGDEADALVAEAKVESLFKASLEMDIRWPKNFGRAGCFYLELGRRGEAERCFAQGFRLDRSQPMLAGNLAHIYNDSDRPQDALAVLDLCIREGCQDPGIAWEAGITAMRVERYDSALTYFDFHESLAPGRLWTNYYRAWALLETKRPQDALEALELESTRVEHDVRLNLEVLRAWAMLHLENIDDFRKHFRQAMAIPPRQIDYLTVSGISKLLGKCYELTKDSPQLVAECECIRRRLLECGLAPSELFREARKEKEVVADLNYFILELKQPLDERWPGWNGCLESQAEWKDYLCQWGVLAADEEEAKKEVLAWQEQCYPLPADILECELQEKTYSNTPGVIWQGIHRQPE
jgi:tetratricopeptide (TPR) repeat protein